MRSIKEHLPYLNPEDNEIEDEWEVYGAGRNKTEEEEEEEWMEYQ